MRVRLLFLIVLLFATGAAKAQDDVDKKSYRSKTLLVNGAEIEVQALVLDSGKITLLKAIDYYLEIQTGSQLTTVILIKEGKEYKSQLKKYMADCPILLKLISKTKFNNADLTRVVKHYNNCSSLTTRELYSPRFTANLGLGLSLIGGSIESSGYTKNLDLSFKPAVVFSLSGALIPSRKKNISLGMEVSFSNKTIEGYSRGRSGAFEIYESETFLNVRYNQFTTAFRFVHYIKTKKRIQPFYSGVVGRILTGKAKTELWNIDSYGSNVFAIKNSSGIKTQNGNYFALLAGVKTPVKTNFYMEFELRFDLQPNQIHGDGISKSSMYSVTPVIRFVLK